MVGKGRRSSVGCGQSGWEHTTLYNIWTHPTPEIVDQGSAFFCNLCPHVCGRKYNMVRHVKLCRATGCGKTTQSLQSRVQDVKIRQGLLRDGVPEYKGGKRTSSKGWRKQFAM